MSALTLYNGNDSILTLDGLQNGLSSAYINDATVSVTIVDVEGTTVAGPLTLDYVSSSDGDYRVTVPYDASFSSDMRYTAQVTANGGTGLVGYWEAPLFVVPRELS